MPLQLDYENPRDRPPTFGGRAGAISLIIFAVSLLFVITVTAATPMRMGRTIPPIFDGSLGAPLLCGPPMFGFGLGTAGLWADTVKRWAFAGLVLNVIFFLVFCVPGFFWPFWIMSDLHVAG
jgi:hypothetical protein